MCTRTRFYLDQMVDLLLRIDLEDRHQGVLTAETEIETWIHKSRAGSAISHEHEIMEECLVDNTEKAEHARNVGRG